MLELFCCLALWKMFSIGLDNKKALALFSCPVSFGQNFLFSGHNFSLSAWTFLNEARSQYPTKFNKISCLAKKSESLHQKIARVSSRFDFQVEHSSLNGQICLQQGWHYISAIRWSTAKNMHEIL